MRPIAPCRPNCQRRRRPVPVSATTVPSPYLRPTCASPRSTASPVVHIDSRARASSRSPCPAPDGGPPHVRHCCLREIHHVTTTRPARVVRVAMTSARRGGARQARKRRCGWPPYPATRGGCCRGGLLATLRNGACPYEKERLATRGWYRSRDREYGTVMMMRDQKPNNGVRPSITITERKRKGGALTARSRASHRSFHLRRRFSGLPT